MRCDLVAVVLVAALVTGCGDADSSGPAGSDATTTPPGSTEPAPTTSAAPPTTTIATDTTATTAAATTTTALDLVPTPPTIPPLPARYEPPAVLPTLEGAGTTRALDINDAGAVVGEAYLPLGDEGCCPVAVWWPDPTAEPQRLDRLIGLPEPSSSSALRINDRGQIVVTHLGYGAYLVDPVAESVVEIVIPFAVRPPVLFSAGLNDRGDVVGSVEVAWAEEAEGGHAVMHGFLWEASSRQATDLGTLPGLGSSWANDINDAGQIVGTSRNTGVSTETTLPPDGLPGDAARSFVWDPTTRSMVTLSPILEDVAAINDAGMAISSSGVWLALPGNFVRPDRPLGRFVDINDSGWVLSAGEPGGSVVDPSSWSRVELPEASFAIPTSINTGGQVVGWAGSEALVWQPGTG
jgi:uncharacterized membrane protein